MKTAAIDAEELLQQVLTRLGCPITLAQQVANTLAQEATLRSYDANAIIFRENAPFQDLLVVQSGAIALEINVPSRGRCRILTLGAGDLVGWSALLGRGTMTTSAVAVEATTVVCIPAANLLRMCEANHHLGYVVMKYLAQSLGNRLVATRLQLLDLLD